MSAYGITFEMEELVPIVAQLTERFTGYESTSVTYEKAEQLMGAVLYSIHEFEQTKGSGLVAEGFTAQEAYTQGCGLLKAKMEQTLEQYNQQILHFDAFENLCLKDLIYQGIPEFFKWYDPIYNPQNTILTLDYPLMTSLGGVCGIDAISQYLNYIWMEQQFLGKLQREYIIAVLEAYHPQHEELIENLCSIVFTNLMGHMLLQKPLQDGYFQSEDYERLLDLLHGYDNIYPLLKKIAETFFAQYFSENQEILQYFLPEISNLAVRLQHAMENDCLSHIFPGRLNMGPQ